MPRRVDIPSAHWLRSACLCLCLSPFLANAQPQPPANTGVLTQNPTRATPLCEVVRRSFAAWDLDSDGTLDPREIDRLVVNPAYSGDEGAALAALKLAVRSSKSEPATLTLPLFADQRHEAGEAPLPVPESTDQDRDEIRTVGQRVRLDAKQTLAALEARYAKAGKRIRGVKREIFLDETPDIDHCRQGSLGDCYLVATVGALAHRNPDDIRSMITQTPEGYLVRFGKQDPIHIAPLTDAQIGLTSSTGDEGLWLAVIEQGFGTLRNSTKPSEEQTAEGTDAIAKGGSISATITALTGHRVKSTTMRRRHEAAIAKGEPVEPILAQVRSELNRAVTDRRLAGCGTAPSDTGVKLPPGINGSHAYAVLAFDAARDMVTLWNPHGNSFKPKGPPGVDHGYSTQRGKFEVPITEFAAIFRAMNVETDAPPVAKRKASPKKPQE